MTTPTTCLECGHTQTEPLPAPAPVSWMSLWPLAVILAALITLFFALRADVGSSSGNIGQGMRFMGTSPTTIDDLAELAAGRPGPDLYDRLLQRRANDTQFGWFPDSRFEFGYAPYSELRHSYASIGWPLRMWGSTVGEAFDDPLRGTGFRPLATHPAFKARADAINPQVFEGKSIPVPRWAWWAGTLQFAPPPEERGGRLGTTSIVLPAIGATLGLISLAWLLAGAVGFVVDVRRRRRNRPPVARRIRRWAAGLTALVIVVATIAKTRSGSQLTQDYAKEATTEHLAPPTLAVAELLEHQDDPERNRWLAVRLLEMLRPQEEVLRKDGGVPPSRPLALSSRLMTDWVSHHAWTGWSEAFPLVSTQSWTFVPPATDAVAVKELARFDVEWDGRRVTFHSSPGPNRDDTLSVDVPGLGTLSLAIFAIAVACGAVNSLVRRRQTARRRQQGACIACGHPLPRTAPDAG